MRSMLRLPAAGLVLGLALAGWAAPGAAGTDPGDGVVAPVNFDDASYDDVAIGVPGEDVGGAVDAGAVNMTEGTEAGLRPGALYLQGTRSAATGSGPP